MNQNMNIILVLNKRQNRYCYPIDVNFCLIFITQKIALIHCKATL